MAVGGAERRFLNDSTKCCGVFTVTGPQDVRRRARSIVLQARERCPSLELAFLAVSEPAYSTQQLRVRYITGTGTGVPQRVGLCVRAAASRLTRVLSLLLPPVLPARPPCTRGGLWGFCVDGVSVCVGVGGCREGVGWGVGVRPGA